MQLLQPPTPVILMVHLPPLPGSPRAHEDMPRLVERACHEARIAREAGADALLIENYGDAPFFKDRVPPATIAAMAVILARVREVAALPVGVNVLRNDAAAALSIASAAGGSFIRVNVHCGARLTDQGITEGRAAETLRLRRQLNSPVAILADLAVKHSQPLALETLEQAAKDTAYRGLADALIVTGSATGAAVDLQALRTVKEAVPDRPLYAGSGVTEDNVADLLALADGVIVGTAVKVGALTENPLDPDRARRLAARARQAKSEI